MELTPKQQDEIILGLGARVNPLWTKLTPNELATFHQDMREKVIPLILALPADLPKDELLTMAIFFREAAIELVLTRMRRMQIYRGESDSNILEHLDGSDLERYGMYLLALTYEAFDFLPRDPLLADLLDEFSFWDVDSEVAALVERFRRGL